MFSHKQKAGLQEGMAQSLQGRWTVIERIVLAMSMDAALTGLLEREDSPINAITEGMSLALPIFREVGLGKPAAVLVIKAKDYLHKRGISDPLSHIAIESRPAWHWAESEGERIMSEKGCNLNCSTCEKARSVMVEMEVMELANGAWRN